MKIIEGKTAAVLDAELQEPVEYAAYEIPVIAAKKPEEYTPQALEDAEMKVPVRCVPRRIFDRDIRKPVDSVPKQASDLEMRNPMNRTIPARLDEAAPVQAETATQIADYAAEPLQTTMAQVVPATQELGQFLDETRFRRSDLKKRQRFAENILHINPHV